MYINRETSPMGYHISQLQHAECRWDCPGVCLALRPVFFHTALKLPVRDSITFRICNLTHTLRELYFSTYIDIQLHDRAIEQLHPHPGDVASRATPRRGLLGLALRIALLGHSLRHLAARPSDPGTKK